MWFLVNYVWILLTRIPVYFIYLLLGAEFTSQLSYWASHLTHKCILGHLWRNFSHIRPSLPHRSVIWGLIYLINVIFGELYQNFADWDPCLPHISLAGPLNYLISALLRHFWQDFPHIMLNLSHRSLIWALIYLINVIFGELCQNFADWEPSLPHVSLTGSPVYLTALTGPLTYLISAFWVTYDRIFLT